MKKLTFLLYAQAFYIFTFLIIFTFIDIHADDYLNKTYPFQIKRVHSDYEDDEIKELWSSLSDINHPTFDDFLKVENYLKYGRRPYLDIIFNHGIKTSWGYHTRNINDPFDRSMIYANRVLQRLMLVGNDKEMPECEIIALNGVSKEDLSRVVVLYSSYNYDATFGEKLYEKKMKDIVNELKEQGYEGHVFYRTGGYPMIEKGGLYLAHVPYSFKILSIIEASQMGYRDVLWIDTSMHPTSDLSQLFNEIKNRGLYIVYNGINLDYDYNFGIFPNETVKSCNLEIQNLSNIPHTIATIIGVSFKNADHHDFIREWYRLTTATIPAMSLYPEEFLISIAAFRTHKNCAAYWWEVMDTRSATPIKPQKSSKPFWNDKS